MFTLNDQPINIYNPITIEGVTYPHLRDAQLRAELGVVEAPGPEWYDERFYWGPGNPKQLNDETVTPEGADPYVQTGLKTQHIAQAKETAGKILLQTDWYVTRKYERGVEIPAEIASKRALVVAEADRLEVAIQGCGTVEELIEVLNDQRWPA